MSCEEDELQWQDSLTDDCFERCLQHDCVPVFDFQSASYYCPKCLEEEDD